VNSIVPFTTADGSAVRIVPVTVVAPAGAPNPPIRMADAASRIIFTARAPLTGSLGLNPRFIFICPTS